MPVDGLLVGGPEVPAFDQNRRDQYLAFGFVVELPPDGNPLALLGEWSRLPRRSTRSVSESGLVREGVRALRAAFEECAATTPSRTEQVVFLSGGLDSRAILGALRTHYDQAEVLAATFGSPGEQDFDFAATVARAAGVRHEVLGPSSVDWTTEGLVDSVLAREIPLPYPFGQRYLSYRLHQHIGADRVFWDGLAGDVTGGMVTAKGDDRRTWDEAVSRFLALQVVPHSARYTSPGFRPESAMPAAPFVDDGLLSYPDQLLLAVRQTRYTATRRMRGYTVLTPFLTRPWLDFMLGVPIRYRHERRLYMTILRQAHPRLFTLPTTTFDGAGVPASPVLRPPLLLQRRVVRKVQRMGWPSRSGGQPDSGANNAIRRAHRRRADIRALIVDDLTDLAARGVVAGLDADAITRAVDEQEISDTQLSVLLGLEVNLKAIDRIRDRTTSAQGLEAPGHQSQQTPSH
jgi:hypothetical protein